MGNVRQTYSIGLVSLQHSSYGFWGICWHLQHSLFSNSLKMRQTDLRLYQFSLCSMGLGHTQYSIGVSWMWTKYGKFGKNFEGVHKDSLIVWITSVKLTVLVSGGFLIQVNKLRNTSQSSVAFWDSVKKEYVIIINKIQICSAFIRVHITDLNGFKIIKK